MTKEEIIEMVEQTDLLGIIDSQYYENELWISDVVEFAKLIVEKEREECAKIADEWVLAYPHPSKTIAEQIRKRGQE